MADRPNWEWKPTPGPRGELSLLPIPLEIPIGRLSPHRRWRVALARGLWVENEPPWRMVVLGERTVGFYPIDNAVQERLVLVQLAAQGWMPATAWAAAFGLHRNSLGNWTWRYRYFGLDGLRDDVLPGRDQLRAVVVAVQEFVQAQGGRVTAAVLREELKRRGLPELPPDALREVLLSVKAEAAARGGRPEARGMDLDSVADAGDAGSSESPPDAADAESSGPPPDPDGNGGGGSAPAEPDSGRDPPQDAADPEPSPPSPNGDRVPTDDGIATAAHREAGSADARTQQPSALVPAVAVEVLPPPPSAGDVALREAGVALVLPAAQALLDPLEPFLEAHWGDRPWYYRPLDMILAFILYVLSDFRNPEQVKAAPTRDFGPLLGRRRGPACITLRRRLPALAANLPLAEELQQRIAEAYLRLGWVVPGWWLLDGHFSPYFGKQEWAKGWWPQRRMPQEGYVQEWIHDRRGRPLWMHLTQAFELFADQIPVVADGLREVLSAAGVAEPLLLVFDRGGYNSEVFRSLNVRGVGWVTWLKGDVVLGPEAFTGTCQLQPGRPGEPARSVHYATYTHRVQGCHDHVAAIAWHFGDAEHPVALLHNTDCAQPGRWTAPQLIAILEGRWSQENGFKAMMDHVDVDWTNGYAHEPCAQTPVPNPEGRRLRARLGERTVQLRRAMNKPSSPRPDVAARQRRRLGTLRGQITRLTRRLAQTPDTVAYGSLGRRATTQLQPGRGLLFPVLRAAAYHLRLQLHDHIAAVFPDRREQDKVLRALLKTPGRYVRGADADWIVLQRPHLPRYAVAMAAVIGIINATPPHAPGYPDRPLRFALEM